MFGTGISPGFAELLAIVAASICDRVDKVTVNEAADTTFYDSPATERPVGFGQPINHPDLPSMAATGTAVFGEAVPPEFGLFDFGGEFSVLGMCHWNLLQFVTAGSLLSGAVFVLRLGGSRAYKVLRSASRRALDKVPI